MRRLTLLAFLFSSLFFICAFTLTVEAKKEKPLSSPFQKEVVHAIRCDVCGFVMKEAFANARDLFNDSAKTRVRVTEDDVLSSFEEICLPLSTPGQWIRRLQIQTYGVEKPFLKVVETRIYSKCKRTCSTLVEACEIVVDDDSMDNLPARLLELKRYADANEFAQKMCAKSPICVPPRGLPSDLYTKLLAEIAEDTPEEIPPKEMEVERMMDQMERKENRRHTIYSREEIEQMKRDLLSGNRESVSEFDPSFDQMDEDEFEALRGMVRNEHDESQRAEEDL